MDFRGCEHPRINVAAQGGGLRPGPICPQQLRRQQRVAQMQTPIFVNQQGAHEKAVLRRDFPPAFKLGRYRSKALDEALIAKP